MNIEPEAPKALRFHQEQARDNSAGANDISGFSAAHD